MFINDLQFKVSIGFGIFRWAAFPAPSPCFKKWTISRPCFRRWKYKTEAVTQSPTYSDGGFAGAFPTFCCWKDTSRATSPDFLYALLRKPWFCGCLALIDKELDMRFATHSWHFFDKIRFFPGYRSAGKRNRRCTNPLSSPADAGRGKWFPQSDSLARGGETFPSRGRKAPLHHSI